METQHTSAMYPSAIARRCRFSADTAGSLRTLSAASRTTLSTSSFAPFHSVRIPCSAACSSSFLSCSGDKPECSAAWSFSNTALSSNAERRVDTLCMSISSTFGLRRDAAEVHWMLTCRTPLRKSSSLRETNLMARIGTTPEVSETVTFQCKRVLPCGDSLWLGTLYQGRATAQRRSSPL